MLDDCLGIPIGISLEYLGIRINIPLDAYTGMFDMVLHLESKVLLRELLDFQRNRTKKVHNSHCYLRSHFFFE